MIFCHKNGKVIDKLLLMSLLIANRIDAALLHYNKKCYYTNTYYISLFCIDSIYHLPKMLNVYFK